MSISTNSWEVDALNPVTLHEIIDANVLALIDKDKFDDVLEQEVDDKVILKALPRIRTEHGELVKKNEDLIVDWREAVDKIEEYDEKIGEIKALASTKDASKKVVNYDQALDRLANIKKIVNG